MALPIFQRTVTNSAGDVIEGAQVSVFDESTGLLSTIYSNREGTAALSNPFLTGSDGLASFYAQQGEYRISVSSVAGSVTWRYQPLIGTLDEGAAVLQAGIYAQESAGYANTAIDARDAAIGAANYKGTWEGKTGAGSIGDSYSYDGAYIYALNVNLANISTSEPSPTNTDWQLINTLDFTPSVKPTMVLDFANENFEIYDGFGTGFAEKPLNNIVTHTRASSATGVDPIGRVGTVGTNIPRLVFEDGVAKGYLSEEARTNLLTQSEFENGLSDAPNRSGLVTLDSMDLGNGAVNALAFGYDGVTQTRARKALSVTAGSIYSFSVFVEMDNDLPPNFGNESTTDASNDFVIFGAGGSIDPTSYIVDRVFSNTYRISGNRIASVSAVEVGVVKYATNSPRTFKVTGYQLEVGSFPTSYIKTQASTVTRTADSMTRTLGQEWNPNEGTFVVEFDLDTVSDITSSDIAIGRRLIISNGINLRYIYLQKTTLNVIGVFDGSNIVTVSGFISVGRIKVAVSFTENEGRISVNGSETSIGSINGSALLNSQTIQVKESFSGLKTNGAVHSIDYYPKALPANELQELSRL